MENNFKHYKNSLDIVICSVRYHAFNKRISIIWKNTATAESIRQIKDELLDMIRTKQCTSLINDLEDFYTASPETLALLINGWDKEITDSGIVYIAHIYNQIIDLPEPADGPPNVRFFNNKIDAVDWLDKQS
jgi:hypothetical protein